MLEIAVIRNNPALVKERLAVKNFAELNLVDEAVACDEKRRTVQKQLDDNLNRQNIIAKEIGELFKSGKKEEAESRKKESANLKEESKQLDAELVKSEVELRHILVRIPNLPSASVPKGHSPAENELIKEWGEKPLLHEGAQPHWELAKKYDLFDLELGVKITGSGFPVYKGKGAKLQRSLIAFFLDAAIHAGYLEI